MGDNTQNQQSLFINRERLIQYSQTNLPFDGVNHSGIGKAHGFYAFQEFSNLRAILKHHRFAPLKLVFPPYTKFVQKLANIIVKYF